MSRKQPLIKEEKLHCDKPATRDVTITVRMSTMRVRASEVTVLHPRPARRGVEKPESRVSADAYYCTEEKKEQKIKLPLSASSYLVTHTLISTAFQEGAFSLWVEVFWATLRSKKSPGISFTSIFYMAYSYSFPFKVASFVYTTSPFLNFRGTSSK